MFFIIHFNILRDSVIIFSVLNSLLSFKTLVTASLIKIGEKPKFFNADDASLTLEVF